MAAAKQNPFAKAHDELKRLQHMAPARLPYRDDDDLESFPAEAEVAAENAMAAHPDELELERQVEPLGKPKKVKERFAYYALISDGALIEAPNKRAFIRALRDYHPDQVVKMMRGREIPKVIKPTLAL